ncbi:MAG TPA: hypothetical protein VF257_11900 [Solirubrobacteraceae bacterium]
MPTEPFVPVVDSDRPNASDGPAAEIELEELLEARSDGRVKDLLKRALAEGERAQREGRQRW